MGSQDRSAGDVRIITVVDRHVRQLGQPLASHKQYVTAISWEPLHRNPECNRLASSSKVSPPYKNSKSTRDLTDS